MTGEDDAHKNQQRYQQLNRDAERGGYHLNPDISFTMALIEGLEVNRDRFGYEACPCRLATGEREADTDIICPCDYRDADLTAYGACYCGLYLSASLIQEGRSAPPVPERRPPRSERGKQKENQASLSGNLPYPVWRCRVCGYLAARDNPPDTCPVCKARADRFEIFLR